MKHPLPDVQVYVDTGVFGVLGEAHLIVEKHFIIADMDAQRRKTGNVLRER